MVGPIKREPMQPPEHAKPVDQKKPSTNLQKEKDTVSKLTKGRFGAGKPPQFSTQASTKQEKVAKVVKDTFHLSKG